MMQQPDAKKAGPATPFLPHPDHMMLAILTDCSYLDDQLHKWNGSRVLINPSTLIGDAME
jgi:hypothetical protein